MDDIKLKQCYHCYQLAGHLKPNCPHISDPKLCAKCGESEHGYVQCQNEAKCINCGGSHPSTSRVCSTYAIKFQELKPKLLTELLAETSDDDLIGIFKSLQPSIKFKLTTAVSQLTEGKIEYIENYQNDSTLPKSPTSSDGEVVTIISQAAGQSDTAYEFIQSLYNVFRANSPKQDQNDNDPYNIDLPFSRESLHDEQASIHWDSEEPAESSVLIESLHEKLASESGNSEEAADECQNQPQDLSETPLEIIFDEDPTSDKLYIRNTSNMDFNPNPDHGYTTLGYYMHIKELWKAKEDITNSKGEKPICLGHENFASFLRCMINISNRQQCPHFPEKFKGLSDSEIVHMTHNRPEDPLNKASPHTKYKYQIVSD